MERNAQQMEQRLPQPRLTGNGGERRTSLMRGSSILSVFPKLFLLSVPRTEIGHEHSISSKTLSLHMSTCRRWMQSVRWYRSGASSSASFPIEDGPDTLVYPVSAIRRFSLSVERRETYHPYPSCFDPATGSSCLAPAAEPITVRSPFQDLAVGYELLISHALLHSTTTRAREHSTGLPAGRLSGSRRTRRRAVETVRRVP